MRRRLVLLLPLVYAACGQKAPTPESDRATATRLVIGPWVRTQQGFAVRGYAGLARDSVSILFGASIRNPGPAPVEVVLEGCATGARAFGSAGRAGRPLWRAMEPGCPMIGPIGRRLAPGDTLPMAQFNQSFPINPILGDSLPDGLYHFEVRPPVGIGSVPVTAEGNAQSGRGFVPAGALRLARRPPASR